MLPSESGFFLLFWDDADICGQGVPIVEARFRGKRFQTLHKYAVSGIFPDNFKNGQKQAKNQRFSINDFLLKFAGFSR